jgi:Beta-glucanase/Beta-glucan synthetase
MVCEFKNIRAIVAAGIITLAACSGDKICEPPAPQIESSSSAISSSSDNGGTELSSCSKADSGTEAGMTSSSIDGGSEPATTSSSTVSSSSSSKDSKADDSSSSTKSSSSVSVEKPSSSSAELSPKPFWNDEFDGDAIDNSKWTYDIGTGASGWGNNEWEYYTDRKENAYIKDGILHIRAQKEDYNGSKYTSARMLTKGKFSFKYGTVEARIALPTGKGIWPAFWMLGENFDTAGWPACGEIDIIEAVNSENIVYGTNHWANGSEYATYGNNTGNYREQKHELDITQFHTYKFTWDEKYIRMFVDDFMYHEILIENNTGDTEEFHKPFFFLLNVAVAGNWPGFEVDDSQFPNEMLVDYIRVFEP